MVFLHSAHHLRVSHMEVANTPHAFGGPSFVGFTTGVVGLGMSFARQVLSAYQGRGAISVDNCAICFEQVADVGTVPWRHPWRSAWT